MQAESSGTKPRYETSEIPLPEEHFRELGVASRATFFRWRHRRGGLPFLRVGGRIFIKPSELTKFLERVGTEE